MAGLGLANALGTEGFTNAIKEIIAQKKAEEIARQATLYKQGQDTIGNAQKDRALNLQEQALNVKEAPKPVEMRSLSVYDPVTKTNRVRLMPMTEGGDFEAPHAADAKPSAPQILRGILGQDNKPHTQQRDASGAVISDAPEYVEPKTPASNDAQNQRSYQYTASQLESLRKPLADRADRISKAIEVIGQQTPQADALAAPAIMTAIVGGSGSGLRMNEAEISRIVGGRSKWETLKASLNQWSLDPSKALAITPDQRQQMRALIGVINDRTQQQIAALEDAQQSLVDAPDTISHRRILADAHKKLDGIMSSVSPSGAGSSKQTKKTANGTIEKQDDGSWKVVGP